MTPAERQIRARIADRGAIAFAEFMRIALYHMGGYYPNRKPIGAGGDYFTSPVAHPAFGALICVQLRQMWRTLGCPASFWAIECGAGDGILANDVIAYARRQYPEFARALRYVAIDRAPPIYHPSAPLTHTHAPVAHSREGGNPKPHYTTNVESVNAPTHHSGERRNPERLSTANVDSPK